MAGHEAKSRKDDWLATAAWVACHHACCAVSNVRSNETRFVPHAGQHAAWALLEVFKDSEDRDRTDPAVWPAAIAAINAAAAA